MGYGRRGIPDFIGVHRREFFSIEVKRDETDKPKPWQEREGRAIFRAGGFHIVAWDVEMVKKVIK